MTASSFELGFLDTAAGSLPFVRRGAGSHTKLLVLQPLFEERNRLRRLLAAVTRKLATTGIESWMFDLPGTGDSPLPRAEASWSNWAAAVQVMAQHVSISPSAELHILSVRGGCLFDALPSRSRYRFAPVAGERLLRELMRARVAGDDSVTVSSLEATVGAGNMIELAGYPVCAHLATGLRDAIPSDRDTPLRIAVVGEGAADVRLAGPPLWRQAEPADEPALAAALAADVAAWISACSAR